MSLGESAFSDEDDDFVDELKPGTELMLGQYTIESFLNAGGFGITYTARDSLNRLVVIKECFPGNFCRRKDTSVAPRSRAFQPELKSIVRLFSQEALSLAKADHPNIVAVHQVFEENNTAYMALDFVEGRDLLDYLTDTPEELTPDRVEKYLSRILDAVGFVHSQGILHRDISPDNIIVDRDDEPVLIDFGAARETTNEKASRMLSALRVVKDGYSPQEFYVQGSNQGPHCDLYSLAATFYHIITGTLPPDSQRRLSVFATGEADPYVPLAQVSQGYSERFCAALDKAMSVLPKERMQSAEEWLDYLDDKAPVAAPVAEAATAEVVPVDNTRKLVVLLCCTAIAAIIAAGVYFAPGRTATEDEGANAQTSADAAAVQVTSESTDIASGFGASDVDATSSATETTAARDSAPAVSPVPSALPNSDAESAALPRANGLGADQGSVPTVETEIAALEAPAAAEGSSALTSDMSITSEWSVRLPFTAKPDAPSVVGSVIFSAWSWLEEGVQIVSANGVEIDGIPA